MSANDEVWRAACREVETMRREAERRESAKQREQAKAMKMCDCEELQKILIRHGASELLHMLATEILMRNLDGTAESMRLAAQLDALADGYVPAPIGAVLRRAVL